VIGKEDKVKAIEIVVRCAKQPEKHAKKIRVSSELGMEWAQMFAGLLDGSSQFYIYKPGPNSPIGKCATCGGELSAEITEVEVKDAEHE